MTSEILRFGSCSERTFLPLNYKVHYPLFSPGDFMVLFLKIQMFDSDFHFRLECRRTWKIFVCMVTPRKTQTYKKSHFPKGLTKIGTKEVLLNWMAEKWALRWQRESEDSSTPGKSAWSRYGKAVLETLCMEKQKSAELQVVVEAREVKWNMEMSPLQK